MGFSFLAPLFLAGLAALAIPILIHLTHRERSEAVPFPSLMFVRKIPYRTARRQRIRNWLLFLVRTLAIVLVVAAFARPLLKGDDSSLAGLAGARELVILLDHSHSMAYRDRWERAVDEARRAIQGLGPEDQATLVLFAERAEAVTQPTADRAILSAALGDARAGSGATRYGSALQLAREILERGDRPRSEVLLITDFQRSGWDTRQVVRLGRGTTLSYVDLSEPGTANLSIQTASVDLSRERGRELVAVAAQVANFGDRARADVSVRLDLDGEPVQMLGVDIEPAQSERVQFPPVPMPRRVVNGSVRVEDVGLPGDDTFRFVIAPEDPLSVLIVEPRGAGAEHSLYLRQALQIAQRPAFQVDVVNVGQLGARNLTDRRVVVLNDAPFPGGAAGRNLSEFVSDGGGLLAVLGRRSPPTAWSAVGLGVLPGVLGPAVEREGDGGGTLGFLDYDHPVFELFRAPRSGDFSASRFFVYRRIESADSVRVLARYDDGGVALVEGRYGAGTVLVWTSDFVNFWNDLSVQPVFLPLAHRLARHLSGYKEPRRWFRVGDIIDLWQVPGFLDQEATGSPELVIERPLSGSEAFRLDDTSRYVALSEAGFHFLRYAGADDGRSFTVAANIDPAESDLTSLDPEELAGAVAVEDDEAGETAGVVIVSPEEQERRQGLWWYLLAGAGALLLSEMFIANRASRRIRPRSEEE